MTSGDSLWCDNGGSQYNSAAFFNHDFDGDGGDAVDNLVVTGIGPEPRSVDLALMGLASAGAVSMRRRLG